VVLIGDLVFHAGRNSRIIISIKKVSNSVRGLKVGARLEIDE
jgi:hypothetical protein